MNLRKADLRGVRHHPVIGPKRDLEAAAQRKTIDRRDGRHRQIVEHGDDGAVSGDESGDVWLRLREDAGEFENIGTDDECPWRW